MALEGLGSASTAAAGPTPVGSYQPYDPTGDLQKVFDANNRIGFSMMSTQANQKGFDNFLTAGNQQIDGMPV